MTQIGTYSTKSFDQWAVRGMAVNPAQHQVQDDDSLGWPKL